MSGIATDVMLFHQHGARLVHRYRVYADNLPHKSLRGPFMLRLARFTRQVSAEAHSTATCGWDSHSESAPTLLRQAHRAPDWRSARAAATVTFAANVSADIAAPAQAALEWADISGSAEAVPASFPAAVSVCRVSQWSDTGSCRVASLCPVPD